MSWRHGNISQAAKAEKLLPLELGPARSGQVTGVPGLGAQCLQRRGLPVLGSGPLKGGMASSFLPLPSRSTLCL